MKAFLILLAVLVTPHSAFAQITVEQTQAMSFGTIIVAPEGDIIRVRPNGRTTSNNGSDLQGGESQAVFLIRGNKNTTVSYSFSTNDTLTANGQSIRLTNFETNRSNPFKIPGSGRRSINLGASITIPSNIKSGSFTGTFIITIDNQ